MDVPGFAFGWELLPMLQALSTSHFVALDFEMSGIPPSQTFKGQHEDTGKTRKMSLQQRYVELKQAAEKFQILQVGITIVQEDKHRSMYVAQPWNMFLSPQVEETLTIERDVTFQNLATGFLIGQGFRMDGPFHHGVPYLSRDETTRAIAMERMKRDIGSIRNIKLRDEEKELKAFVDKARRKIEQWRKTNPRPNSIVISGEDWEDGHGAPLSNWHKRLIHQLVRCEFRECVSVGRQGYIEIGPFDEARERAVQKEQWDRFESRLGKQVGVRWLFEGMVGGCLDQVDPEWFFRPGVWFDRRSSSQHLSQLIAVLRARRPVLVGHNLLLDLVFFYSTFIGKLPERIEDFVKKIHFLWPLVIDTKYMTSHHSENPSHAPPLAAIDAEACTFEFPMIEVPTGHERYLFEAPVHEAGYDSFMTARVLIKIAARLRDLGWYRKDLDKEEREKLKAAKREKESRFAHPIMYDLLEFDGSNDEPDPTTSNEATPQQTAAALLLDLDLPPPMLPPPEPAAAPRPGDYWHWTPHNPPTPPMMPDWADPIWRVYGNKLRVNGTAEGVCHLDGEKPRPRPAPAAAAAPAPAPAAGPAGQAGQTGQAGQGGFRMAGKRARRRQRKQQGGK